MNKITVETTVKAPLDKVWKCWNEPSHITKWAFASDHWETPEAVNDVRLGGKFKIRMQSKDKKEGFDFEGTYTTVKEHELIEYDMTDGRHVKVKFRQASEGVKITETFDPENENSEELQRKGWQAILNNFKKYIESQ